MTLRLRVPQGDLASAFAQLAAPPERIFVQEAGQATLLPACCGTYAFYDGAGALLYIGKAKNVRARVLGHFREPSDSTLLLRSWTHRIVRIEIRPAESEMEALLVEADLVARLGPPFNRQMRSWSRYCYLVPTNDHSAPLSISCQLQSWKRSFGPFRSRKQAVRIIEAVFRLVSRNCDADMLAKCYRLLGGQEDSLVGDLERQQETLVAANKNESWMRSLPQLTETLKKASERAVLLRNAEDILGGLIIMPGSDGGRTIAVITDAGLHLERIEPNNLSAQAFQDRYRAWTGTTSHGQDQRLPKSVSDCLCVASRQMRQHLNKYRLMRREKASGLSASDLLAFVFDGLNG